MSNTYFKKSNIEKLTKKSTKNKDKKYLDEKNLNEKDKDDKVVENFSMTDPTGSSDSSSGNGSGSDPMSNIFSSSDNSDSKGTDDSTNDDSTNDDGSNISKAVGNQLDPDKYLVFTLHALLSVLFAYAWGFLATNALYLITESKEDLDYIFPVDEYQLPYTKISKPKCAWSYGFPYDLGEGRIVGDAERFVDIEEIKKRQKEFTYFLWLSKEGKENLNNKEGFFPALTQYLFEAVYGGLGKGGRTFIRILLSLFSIKDKTLDDNKGTWYGKMENSIGLKVAVFILWPWFMTNLLIPIIGLWTGITTFVYGILQIHIIWGLIFSFTIGMFIAMGNGFYMALQSIYTFFIYPWSNSDSDTNNKWRDIFNSLKTYMLFAFYFLICYYGYEDLGSAGGGGIMFIVVVSIIMQYMKNSS